MIKFVNANLDSNLDAFTHTQACAGLRGDLNSLTQKSRKSQNFSINANLDTNLDTKSLVTLAMVLRKQKRFLSCVVVLMI